MREEIEKCLSPLSPHPLSLGDCVQREGLLAVTLVIEGSQQAAFVAAIPAMEAALSELENVERARVVLTAVRESQSGPGAKRPAQWNLTPLENVKRIIAVASGKGGVGKSTTTVGLAHALVAAGKKVGILDADIYGPSIPRMLALQDAGQPPIANNRILPLENHGIHMISMGNIAGDRAAIMRGPMISKALNQMLRTTLWAPADAPIDILLIDLPPGTGDIQLSLAQSVPLDGAVLVTTPQEIALADVEKSARMFQKIDVDLLGVVENMSGFTDPSGQFHSIFGEGGGQKLAEAFNCPLLGQIPLEPALRAAMDAGEKPDFSAYSNIAKSFIQL